MFSKLLLVLGVAFAYGTSLTFNSNNKVSYTPNYSYRYDFIDYESPAYRLGDYDITQLDHISAGGGQVRYNRIQAIIPRVVFDTLAEFENVFISMPLYDYNSAVDLYMRIDLYLGGVLEEAVISDLENIPLSMTMLKSLPYTMVDLPNNFNIFDSSNWEFNFQAELRLTFVVPFTAYIQPPSDYAEQLRNITLFTQLYMGELDYNDGYVAGYNDGLTDGFNDGYSNGKEIGYNDGYADGDLDGYNRGLNEDFNAYSYLFGMFGAFSGLFAVELLPGLTIGGIAILVLTLTLLPFLIGLFTKGGKK